MVMAKTPRRRVRKTSGRPAQSPASATTAATTCSHVEANPGAAPVTPGSIPAIATCLHAAFVTNSWIIRSRHATSKRPTRRLRRKPRRQKMCARLPTNAPSHPSPSSKRTEEPDAPSDYSDAAASLPPEIPTASSTAARGSTAHAARDAPQTLPIRAPALSAPFQHMTAASATSAGSRHACTHVPASVSAKSMSRLSVSSIWEGISTRINLRA